jgi:hypothetical protein
MLPVGAPALERAGGGFTSVIAERQLIVPR